jgi:hypothetical protein
VFRGAAVTMDGWEGRRGWPSRLELNDGHAGGNYGHERRAFTLEGGIGYG